MRTMLGIALITLLLICAGGVSIVPEAKASPEGASSDLQVVWRQQQAHTGNNGSMPSTSHNSSVPAPNHSVSSIKVPNYSSSVRTFSESVKTKIQSFYEPTRFDSGYNLRSTQGVARNGHGFLGGPHADGDLKLDPEYEQGYRERYQEMFGNQGGE